MQIQRVSSFGMQAIAADNIAEVRKSPQFAAEHERSKEALQARSKIGFGERRVLPETSYPQSRRRKLRGKSKVKVFTRHTDRGYRQHNPSE